MGGSGAGVDSQLRLSPRRKGSPAPGGTSGQASRDLEIGRTWPRASQATLYLCDPEQVTVLRASLSSSGPNDMALQGRGDQKVGWCVQKCPMNPERATRKTSPSTASSYEAEQVSGDQQGRPGHLAPGGGTEGGAVRVPRTQPLGGLRRGCSPGAGLGRPCRRCH